jgi:hypothetical protein
MRAKNIHNLDSLEREIYRLSLEAKKKEEEIDNNFDYLRSNFGSLLINSFSCKMKKNAEQKSGLFESTLKDETLKSAFTKVTDHITNRTIEGIDELITRMFRKKHH